MIALPTMRNLYKICCVPNYLLLSVFTGFFSRRCAGVFGRGERRRSKCGRGERRRSRRERGKCGRGERGRGKCGRGERGRGKCGRGKCGRGKRGRRFRHYVVMVTIFPVTASTMQ